MKAKLLPYSKSIEKSVKKQLTRTLFIQIITDGNPSTTAKSLRLFLRSMKWRKDDKISTDEFYSIYNAFIKLLKKPNVKQKPITYRIFSSLFVKCSLSDIHQYVKTMQKLPRRHWVLLGIYQKPILKQILRIFRILDWKSCGALTMDELYPFILSLKRNEGGLKSISDQFQITEKIVDLASIFIQKTSGGLMTFRRFLECFPREETKFQKNAISTFEYIANSLDKHIFPYFYNHPLISDSLKEKQKSSRENYAQKEEEEEEEEEEVEGEENKNESGKKNRKKPKKKRLEKSDFLNVLNFWEIACLETHINRCEQSYDLLEYLLDETAFLRGGLGISIFVPSGQYTVFQNYIENFYEKNNNNKKKGGRSGGGGTSSESTNNKNEASSSSSSFELPRFVSEEYRNIFSFVSSVCEKYRELLNTQIVNVILKDWEAEEKERIMRKRNYGNDATKFSTSSLSLISVIRSNESPLRDVKSKFPLDDDNEDEKRKDKEIQTIGSLSSASVFQDTIREYGGVHHQVSPSLVQENETIMEIKKEFSDALKSLKEHKKKKYGSGRKIRNVSKKLF